jgi:hypothetical protein
LLLGLSRLRCLVLSLRLRLRLRLRLLHLSLRLRLLDLLSLHGSQLCLLHLIQMLGIHRVLVRVAPLLVHL